MAGCASGNRGRTARGELLPTGLPYAVRRGARNASAVVRGSLSVVLSVLLVFGMAPAELWAEGVASAGDAVSSALQERSDDDSREPEPVAEDVPETSAPSAETNSASEHAPSAHSSSRTTTTSHTSANEDSASSSSSDTQSSNGSSSVSVPLEEVAALLEGERPTPVYGTDTNLNDVVRALLAAEGIDDVEVRVASVEYVNRPSKASLSVSAEDDETNGDITYFFIDPDDVSGFANYVQWCQVRVTFSLSRDGQTVLCTPSRALSIPWDEAKVEQMLQEDAAQLVPIFAEGDTAESVTGDLVLPYKLPGKSWSTVTWTSSDPNAVSVEGYGYEDYAGVVTRAASDTAVTLNATVGVVSSGGPATTVEVSFPVTVKGDSDRIEEERAELLDAIDAAFSADALSYSEGAVAPGTDFNPQAIEGDLQLPRPRDLGIDGAEYRISYTVSADAIEVNGYRAFVYQPLPGGKGVPVSLTLTVTSKENPEVTARKTIELEVAPLDAADIEAELALMEEAKVAYAEALLEGQDASAVTGDLHAFQKAYRTADGELAWAYDAQTAEDTPGIVPVDLPGYDPMSTAGWRLFRSSDPSVIAHENLVVSQPTYTTDVTITSSLSSERFGRYAEHYGDSAFIWADDLAALAEQEVSATVTVVGAQGENPNPPASEPETLTVAVRITGVTEHDAGEDYEAETWVPLTEVTLDADADATAWNAFARVLDEAGYSYEVQGFYCPYSITSPEGRVLAASDSKPWSYWSFFVNGGYAQEGADTYRLEDGDVIELKYIDGSGSELPSDEVSANPDAEHPQMDVEWNGFANGGAGATTNAPTPTDTADAAWTYALLTEEERAAGASLSSSDALVIDGKLYIVTGSSTYDAANNWAETKSLARLVVIDAASGAVERQVTLGTSMDSTCRPVYADGILVIPLSGGALQAVSAKTLETIWFVSGAEGVQSLSSLTVADGYVYVATVGTIVDERGTSGGIARYNLYTGALAARVQDDTTGYYWSGGIVVDGYYVVGADDGTVRVYTQNLEAVDTLAVSDSQLRSALATDGANIYAVSRDGVFHKLALSESGELEELGNVSFASYSTSAPTIVGGTAYVGGRNDDYTGVLAVINLSSLQVRRIANADGEAILAEVKGTPLVSSQKSGTYVYFTANGAEGPYPNYTSGGGVYVYKLGESEARVLYQPGEGLANYCMASVLVDAEGNLYYTNDSGHLFALHAVNDEGGSDRPGGPDHGSGSDQGTDQVPGGASSGGGAAGAGTVAPSMTPLSGASATDGVEGAGTDEGVPEAVALSASPRDGAAAGIADGAVAMDVAAPLNRWAVAGVAAGIIGLVATGLFLVGGKRRGEDR